MRIVIDAMGSDNNPQPDVAGAVLAAREFGDSIILVGDQAIVEAELAKHDTAGLTIEVHHAPQTIVMTDKPSRVIREKRESSIHIGMNLVKTGVGDAFVTAGHTGATLGIAMLRSVGLGRIPGIKRPALGVVFPTRGQPLLIDNGANADCKPEYLLQFGIMGSLYMEKVRGIQSPRVALLSNGEEEGKGSNLVRATTPLLVNSGLNFIGNIEPKEFLQEKADVIVMDGFTGNIMMKTAEAIGSYMSGLIRESIKASPITMLGGLLAKPAFAEVRKHLDPDEVGGAPLLGVNGAVVVGHGSSTPYAIKQAVGQARKLVSEGVVKAISDGLKD